MSRERWPSGRWRTLGNCSDGLRWRAVDFDYRYGSRDLAAKTPRPSITVNLDKSRPIDKVTSRLRHSGHGVEGAATARVALKPRRRFRSSLQDQSLGGLRPDHQVHVTVEHLQQVQQLSDRPACRCSALSASRFEAPAGFARADAPVAGSPSFSHAATMGRALVSLGVRAMFKLAPRAALSASECSS